MRGPLLAILLPLALAIAACSSNSSSTPTPIATCPPIALPTRDVFLANPAPDATGVPVSIGRLTIEVIGVDVSSDTLAFTEISGTRQTTVSTGTPGPAPSPLPSPLATNDVTGQQAYFGYPVPALSPASTYEVSDTYVFSLESPKCQSAITSDLGSFTTQ